MTVECPRCGTVYRRPARAERGADASYRCARCRHVFAASRDEPVMVSEAEEPGDDDEQFAFDEEREDEPAPPAPPAARAPRDPPPRTMSVARFAVRSMVLVALGYAILSVYLYTHPGAMRDLLRTVPIIGDRLAETRLRPTAVQLTNLRGEYERVQGDRLVFVISGTALNNSPVPVRGVQIEGWIAGAQEQRQVVFCGAAPRDVHDLSLREIALLQTLEPPKEWSLPAGERSNFLVVFPAPPLELREFGAEVVAVQAPTRDRERPETRVSGRSRTQG